MANNRIDSIITSARWEIDPAFGLQALGKYLSDCAMMESGAAFADLGYAEQRAALEPTIVGMSAAKVSGRSSLSDPDIPAGSIAHLRLSGVMRLEDGMSSRGVRSLIQDIRTADANPKIDGILLEVSSGGGESLSGTELQNALTDVQRGGRTVVGVYAQMIASAAIRGTLPAEFIIAAGAGTPVGSIGTYTSIDRDALEYVRENVVDVYARQSTQKNAEYRAMMDGDFEPLIDSLTESAQVFIDEVFAAREIQGTASQIAEVESGKLLTAADALSRNLIDGIGTFDDAVDRLTTAVANNQSTPPAGDLSYQQRTNMNSIQKFLSGLIPSLNTKLGTELKDDATPEAVQDAVDAADGIADIRDALTAASTEQADALTALTEKVNGRDEAFDALTKQVDSLTAANKTLTDAKAAMEKELADLKGTRGNVADDKTTERSNSNAPNVEQYNTTQQFGATLMPGGTSKYGNEK